MTLSWLFAALAALATPSPAPVAGAPSADDLFARMRSKLTSRSYPNEISYAVVVEGWDDKMWHPKTYDSFAFPARGEIRARSVSHEERAHPFDPGNDLQQFTHTFASHVGDPDPLGAPRLLPTYAFGLVPQPHPRPIGPSPAPSDTLRTIGSTQAVAKIYDVTLVGAESVDGDACWHLKLKPRGNPGTYRVRDVWLEQSTFELRRLWTDGNFTSKATGGGIWVVDYVRAMDGSWYIASETSSGAVSADDADYDRMRVRFDGVSADRREFYDTTLSGATAFLEEP